MAWFFVGGGHTEAAAAGPEAPPPLCSGAAGPASFPLSHPHHDAAALFSPQPLPPPADGAPGVAEAALGCAAWHRSSSRLAEFLGHRSSAFAEAAAGADAAGKDAGRPLKKRTLTCCILNLKSRGCQHITR